MKTKSPLAHPIWLLSLALLVLNDHVFKLEPALAGTLTGKLSDFAGLIVAPPLLAVLVRARSPHARALCLALVGAGFAAIKVSSPCAQALAQVLGAVGVPSRFWVDPTDLIALPALLVAQRVLDQAEPAARWFSRSALVTGLLACVATSYAEPAGRYTSGDGSAVLVNHLETTLRARVRLLRGGYRCEVDAGTAELTANDFEPAVELRLAPGEWMFLTEYSPCGAAWLVIGDNFDAVVSWENVPWSSSEVDELPEELQGAAVTVEGTAADVDVTVGEDLQSLPPPTS